MGDFGTDLSCVADFSDECRIVSGNRLLAEALVRRLSTPRGMVIDAPDYGTDLHECLGMEYTSRNIARMLADVKAECLKDERVTDCTPIVLEFSVATRSLSLQIAVETNDDAFVFTFSVDSDSVSLLTVS